MESGFNFKPAEICPVKDRKLLERLAKMTPDEIEKHPNPDVRIKILGNFGSVCSIVWKIIPSKSIIGVL